MLAAPFWVAGAGVVLVSAKLGATATVAVIFAVFGLGWLGALLVAATGKAMQIGTAALVAGAVAAAVVVAAAGGLASPAVLLIAALPLEAFWVWRTKRAALIGSACAAAVLPLQAVIGNMAFAEAASIAAWHWLLPLAWCAALAARASQLTADSAASDNAGAAETVEDLLDAVVLRIARNGDVTDASAKARTMLRLQPELLFGSALFQRVHVADRVAYLCALADMRDGAEIRKLELRLRLPRESAAEAGDNFQPFVLELYRGKGEGQTFAAIIRDNATVADLRVELAQAAEAVKNAELAKGNFLAAVSHELRTPLNAIIGFSDMLVHEMFGAFPDPRQKEYVGIVRDSGQHLLDVVNAILDVSKIESGCYATNPEPFRFGDAVDMCASMLRLQAEARAVDMSVEVATGTGEVNADKRAVQQMLINLVSNAIKFTPDGGSVRIGAKRLGSRLHFWVADTGIGIAEEDLSRLGTPFTQIQNDYTRRFEGTGLGLSLVKGLVALHDGTMAIESAPGEGTTVTISLPIDGPSARPGTQKGELMALPEGRLKEVVHGSLRKAG